MATVNDNQSILAEDVAVDEDASGMPISVPDSGDAGEGGKLKMIIQLVKKCLGVKDIAAMRLSLPASLLEPIPNLEYWNYLDRPDFFAAINDSDDPFERMLAVLRFTFTKDLKFVHGGVCKPYNSVLGEHFRAHWDVIPYSELPLSPTPSTRTGPTLDIPSSDTASVKSSRSSKSTRSAFNTFSKLRKIPSTTATYPQTVRTVNGVTSRSSDSNLEKVENNERVRIVYMTEQVSHHPPISAYYASCPTRFLELRGVDQISAKVSGTTLRVSPGEANQGLFINITAGPGKGEEYRVTHPIASVNGILRGSFYVTVGESTIITCSGGKHGNKLRTVIEYKEESWLGKPHFLVEGVIHSVHEGETQPTQWTKVKHVPHSHIVATFDGSWRGSIRWRRVGLGSYPHISSVASSPSPSHTCLLPEASVSSFDTSKAASKADIVTHDEDYTTLIDLSALEVIPKVVRPLEKQLPNESRKLWVSVTNHLLKKEYSEATRYKVAIEQKQRDAAAERKRKGAEFAPRFFEKDISKGYADLTAEGQSAVEEELKDESCSRATSPFS